MPASVALTVLMFWESQFLEKGIFIKKWASCYCMHESCISGLDWDSTNIKIQSEPMEVLGVTFHMHFIPVIIQSRKRDISSNQQRGCGLLSVLSFLLQNISFKSSRILRIKEWWWIRNFLYLCSMVLQAGSKHIILSNLDDLQPNHFLFLCQ